jgi:predicted transcriptional regulator
VIGYTYRVRKLNRSANKKNIGVRLGRHCIDSNISVSELVELLGVSKQTVYNWFVGVHTPGPKQTTKIQELFAL